MLIWRQFLTKILVIKYLSTLCCIFISQWYLKILKMKFSILSWSELVFWLIMTSSLMLDVMKKVSKGLINMTFLIWSSILISTEPTYLSSSSKSLIKFMILSRSLNRWMIFFSYSLNWSSGFWISLISTFELWKTQIFTFYWVKTISLLSSSKYVFDLWNSGIIEFWFFYCFFENFLMTIS